MGLRARKSITLMKGVKLNLNKGSVGLSVGTKGARYSVNSKGRKTVSVGIPGTGISYVESLGSSKNKKSKSASVVCPKCGSKNVDLCIGLYKREKTILRDLILTICTAGIWLLVIIFRKKKMQKKIYMCKECGKDWDFK